MSEAFAIVARFNESIDLEVDRELPGKKHGEKRSLKHEFSTDMNATIHTPHYACCLSHHIVRNFVMTCQIRTNAAITAKPTG